MGDEQDDFFAERRAAFERQFHELPVPGTADYWKRLEHTSQDAALPLEVLARCLRERQSAGKSQQAKRVYELLLRRIQSRTQHWAKQIAAQCHSDQAKMAEDLQQTCYMELWKELTGDGPTFLLENFLHALNRIQQHVAHALMEQAGEWIRPSVSRPKRVPQQNTNSLHMPVDSDDETTLEEILEDPTAKETFEQMERSHDLLALVSRLPIPLRAVIYDRFYRNWTEEEIASEQKVSERTVRNRLKQALTLLREWYLGGEEAHRG